MQPLCQKSRYVYRNHPYFTNMEIANLIKECKRRNSVAEECLYKAFARPLFAYCRHIVGEDCEAKEALNDGFLLFFTEIDKFNYTSEVALHNWLKSIMRNKCRNIVKRTRTHFIEDPSFAEDIGLEADVQLKMKADEIASVIDAMPPGYQHVFKLFAIEGYSHKEIAALLNISENTSKSQYSRARTLLQELITYKRNNHDRRF